MKVRLINFWTNFSSLPFSTRRGLVLSRSCFNSTISFFEKNKSDYVFVFKKSWDPLSFTNTSCMDILSAQFFTVFFLPFDIPTTKHSPSVVRNKTKHSFVSLFSTLLVLESNLSLWYSFLDGQPSLLRTALNKLDLTISGTDTFLFINSGK